jgi:nucleolar protein 58
VANVGALCDQVLSLSEYRAQLYDYLKSRMAAVAPNLTVLVGELVGARLIAHVGSLINLAKAPASTIQILGAEKALFRALKTKHETPKYGLIYHASLIGQASAKHKGKISRVLAAKCALGVRVDALGDVSDEGAMGLEARQKVRRAFALRAHLAGEGGCGGTHCPLFGRTGRLDSVGSGRF